MMIMKLGPCTYLLNSLKSRRSSSLLVAMLAEAIAALKPINSRAISLSPILRWASSSLSIDGKE